MSSRVLALACALASCAVLSACSAHSGGFERDVVVRFTLPAGTFDPPAASVQAIRANCDNVPGTTMKPVPPASAVPSVRLSGIRFDVRNASDATIAQLQTCLIHQPAVKSADLEDDDT